MFSGLLVRTQDAAGWAEGQREGCGEDASEDHGSVPGGSPPRLRGGPKGSTAGKAASPPLSLCLGFALSIAVRLWQSFCLEVQGNDPGKAQQMGNFHCKKCMLHGCVVILLVFPCVEKS